ncbi:MAG: T9SS type A sorting domain-containing protein [Melioribacteraceae bacterium]|nr:T9SS type A sorting domain-containing protein [Melioribacteraceae bacterium]
MKTLKYILNLIILSPLIIFSQTITSTTNGGHWNSASTWIGGVVPGQNNDVVINGPVVISNQSCNNLTVNTNGIIEDEPSAGRTLTIYGNLTNNGTIRIGNGNAGVTLDIRGNLFNYGNLINRAIVFGGSGAQQITSSKKISCYNISKSPNGTIQAASNIEIDSVTTVDLNGDILNMGSFKLTKHSRKNIDNATDIIIYGTVFSNGELDISGRFGSNLDGNPTLVGATPLLFTGGNIINQNLTIASGKIISDEPSAGRTITINGNLINNGIIKNRWAGLTIEVKGNIINNGEYSGNLRFIGNDNQTMSGSQKYSCGWIEKNPNGKINAASDITIDSTTTFYLDNDVLNMGNFKLTKISKKDIDNSGNIIRGGTVLSNGILEIGGRFGSHLDGNPTLVGTTPLLFTGDNIVNQNLTIGSGKIISDEPSAGRTITINGNLTNNGIIKNRWAGLIVQIKGNVINNGEFSSAIRFIGDNNQTMSGSQKYSCVWIEKVPNGKINAASNLVIDSTTTFNLFDDELNMFSYKLTKLSKRDFVNSTSIFNGGKIFSNGEIDVKGRFGSNLDGEFVLTGKDTMLFTGENIIYKNLRIAKDKCVQEECCAGRKIYVYGDIYNNGIIKNRFGGLEIQAFGNVYNFGKIEINWLIVKSNNNNLKLFGEINSNISLEKSGGSFANVTIDQFLKTRNRFLINTNVTLNINTNAELIVYKMIENNGTVNNNGKITNRYRIFSNGEIDYHSFMKAKPKVIDRATSDSLIVTVSNFIHPKMTSSISRYWQLSGNKKLNSYTIELYYDDNVLNGQDPNFLEAYITSDNGISWKKISNPINTQRDLTNKKITIGTANNPITLVGDIILSSGNVTNVPSISVSISGRKEVRVGPPNRYTISYWNNNNFPTDKFFIKLNANQGVYFDAIYSKKIGTDSIKTIPIDSLVYDNKKDEVILLVQPLAAKEVRSFDIIVKSALGTTFKSTEAITLTAIALWTVGAIVEEYVSNTIVAGCYEMWRPVRHDESLTDASVKVIKNSLKEAVTVENGLKGIAKKGAEEVIKKTTGYAIWPINLAKDVFDCLGNTVRGMKDYVNGNFDKQEKELVKVTSWDPNAKEGPAGFGQNGYMASTSPMNYTIFFENKKEATAPAYQIVILDTLDTNVFDINSVKFLETSHPQAKPTITRNSNILKWDFVGIELPPNAKPPEGEGWVKFTVNLKSNLPTKTVIKNRATITFDINKPLSTNTTINTLDFDSPTSNISSIVKSSSNELSVYWNADDGNGAGIKNVIVYLANADGPFSVAAVGDKSPIKIPVQNNNTYKIYLLATDNVGNTQKSPTKIHDVVVDIEKEDKIIPTEFSLEQNFPNPFNPETTIKYQIPISCDVILKVYDILGKEVYKLVNEFQRPGVYNIKFDAKYLSSGVYFYVLKAGSYIQTRKMIFMK